MTKVINFVGKAFLFLLMPGLVWPGAAAAVSHEELAAYWSPILAQGTRYNFRSDVITSVDFDGDLLGANNFENSRVGHTMPSVVYYSVKESAEHIYLTYSFYHVERGKKVDKTKLQAGYNKKGTVLEHDFDNAVVKVARDDANPMGRFVAVALPKLNTTELGAELRFSGLDPALEKTHHASAIRLAGDVSNVYDVDFVLDTLGFHPVIYSTAGTHDLHLQMHKTQFPNGPAIFAQQSVSDWRWLAPYPTLTGEGDIKRRWHRPGERRLFPDNVIPPDDGLLYRFEGASMDVIRGDYSRGKGTMLHHWNVIAYRLVNWEQISSVDPQTEGVRFFSTGTGLIPAGTESPTNVLPWQEPHTRWFENPASLFPGTPGDRSLPAH